MDALRALEQIIQCKPRSTDRPSLNLVHRLFNVIFGRVPTIWPHIAIRFRSRHLHNSPTYDDKITVLRQKLQQPEHIKIRGHIPYDSENNVERWQRRHLNRGDYRRGELLKTKEPVWQSLIYTYRGRHIIELRARRRRITLYRKTAIAPVSAT